jgi:hypothetical protein
VQPDQPERWPLVALMWGVVPLQRFGLPLGGFKLPLVVAIAALVFGLLAIKGRLVASRRSLSCFLLFAAYGLCCAWLSVVAPPEGVSTSLFSAGYCFITYLFLVLRLRRPPGMLPTLALVRGFVLLLAVAGCLQFAAQFVGLRLFSFTGVVPDALLNEEGYNLTIPLWDGASVFKANGLFLVEPSVLSQFMALGLVIEFLYFGSTLRLTLLLLTMLVSFSGTGMLVLGFALLMGALAEPRSFLKIARFALIGGVTVAIVGSLAAPEYANAILRRTSELNSEHSSGFIRFVSPYIMLGDLLPDPRLLIGFGPGTAERFTTLGYAYGVNALTKVLIEYGVPGLTFYLLLMSSALYRPRMRTLSAVGLFLFVVGGCYFLAPPVLYLLAVLFCWGPAASAGAEHAAVVHDAGGAHEQLQYHGPQRDPVPVLLG